MSPKRNSLQVFRKSKRVGILGVLLAASLSLAWPAPQVSAQSQEETPVRVPPGTKLKATLDGKTADVKVEEKLISVKAEWQLIESASPDKWRIEGLEKPVLPVKYVPQGQVALIVNIDELLPEAADVSQVEDSDLDIDLSGAMIHVKISNPLSREARVLEKQLKPNFNRQGIAVIQLNLDELLGSTGSFVNQNALEAQVRVKWEDKELRAPPTTNLLHILRQKLILFIPGVCGSRITVTSYPDREAYPEWSWFSYSSDEDSPLTVQLNWLHTLSDGSPASKAARLDLFRYFARPENPQTVTEQTIATGGRYSCRSYRTSDRHYGLQGGRQRGSK